MESTHPEADRLSANLELFAEEAPAWLVEQRKGTGAPVGSFYERLLRSSLQIVPRWRELITLSGQVSGLRRGDKQLMRVLGAAIDDVASGVREAFTRPDVRGDVARCWYLVDQVSAVHTTGLLLAALFDPGYRGHDRSPELPEAMTAAAGYFHSAALGLAAIALVEHQALGRIMVGDAFYEGEGGPAPAKERMRAMRERKRRGVLHRAQVELGADDLDLLQLYGFLEARDRPDKRALDAAVADFFFASLLTYRSPTVAQGQKLGRLRSRIQAVSEPRRVWDEHHQGREG